MRKMVYLLPAAACVVLVSSAGALEVKQTTRRVVEGMCGGGIQTGGGHSGCTICTAKNCADYDCTKKSCKIVVFLKGHGGGIRNGGVTTVKGGDGSHPVVQHPVQTGSGVKPMATVGHGGGTGGGRLH